MRHHTKCIFTFFTDLDETTQALEFRVTVLENHVNSSVAELETKVETLEGTTADHETRISSTESSINGKYYSKLVFAFQIKTSTIDNFVNCICSDLEEVTSDQETRLTAAEGNIQGTMTNQ